MTEVFRRTAIPFINLADIPAQRFATIKREVPSIPMTSVISIKVLLPMVLSIFPLERELIPADTVRIATKKPNFFLTIHTICLI